MPPELKERQLDVSPGHHALRHAERLFTGLVPTQIPAPSRTRVYVRT